MQEMDVVKKGSAAWLWILLALAAVAVLLWFMLGGGISTPQTGELFERSIEQVGAAIMAA